MKRWCSLPHGRMENSASLSTCFTPSERGETAFSNNLSFERSFSSCPRRSEALPARSRDSDRFLEIVTEPMWPSSRAARPDIVARGPSESRSSNSWIVRKSKIRTLLICSSAYEDHYVEKLRDVA